MKKISILIIFTLFCIHFGFTQFQNIRLQKNITIPNKGSWSEFQEKTNVSPSHNPDLLNAPLTSGLNWQYSDGFSIGNYVKVSSQSLKTIAAWGTNDQRISLYGDTNTPIWEVPFTITGGDEVIDMTEDGAYIANVVNDQVEVYASGSSTPIWSTTISSRYTKGVQIRNDGQQVFVAAVDMGTQDSSFIYCYNIGQNTPVWIKSFAGNYTALVLSKNGNRLLLGEYGGGNNKLFVLNPATGNQIFQTAFNDQYPPAISDDGKYIVSGDFSGHVFLLEYNESSATYYEKWNYTVSGTSSWVAGMGISGDGSTIAIGTLIFTSGGYDGELYVFNNYSPVPLWIYSNMGDMVQCVDLNYDGSIIATAGWGPIGNTKPDLMLFRKQSNTPYLTINTPGSNFCLDLSADGKLCVAGGKAVHAREMGYGGVLYNINSNLGGGTLSGLAVKSGSSDLAGAKIEIIGLDNYFCFSNDTSSYILKYIPAGTYTTRYSAVGYITQNKEVQIISDQITNQNVTLLPTGNPPINLTATQGATSNVKLNWQPSSATGITGYKIYRKQYLFDFYPETPIGTVSATDTTYIDNTALPLIHYYYAVTAQLTGNIQTPYTNDAEGWTATGFITNEISAWVGSTPTIDGVISPGEWNDAFKIDISNMLGRKDNIIRPVGSVMAWFKVNASNNSLYVAVNNTNDTIYEDHDEIALYIDDNNDGLYPAPGDTTEGNYWATHYASGDVIKFRPIYGTGGVGNTIYLSNPQIKVSNATGHLVYEFVIPLGSASHWQIGFNNQNQSGIFIFALDDPTNYDGWWPCLNQNIFTAEGYGIITFGAIDGTPPPPENIVVENPVPQNIMLKWDQPNISDFDYFNIYWSINNGASFVKLDSTIGVQYFLTAPSNGNYMFYITTVDRAGHESTPSNTVNANVNTGIKEPWQTNDIQMIKMGPNPFNQQLTINFRIGKEANLAILIFDINGKLVKTLYDAKVSNGEHSIEWNGKNTIGNDLNPGTYIIQFQTSNRNPLSFKIVKR